MLAIGLLFVGMLCDWFRSRRQLQAEILILRHQLNILQRRAPSGPYLSWADRALFIWAYRRFPRILRVSGLRPSFAGIGWDLPPTGDGSPVRAVADHGSPKKYAT
jgi:hypothetical protein